MRYVPILVGAAVGVYLGLSGDVLLGLVFGAVGGYLLSGLKQVQKRLDDLERPAHRGVVEPPSALPQAAPQPRVSPLPDTPVAAEAPRETPSERSTGASTWTRPERAEAVPSTRAKLPPAPPATAAQTFFDRMVATAHEWLTTGNVPVKIGVIVSFFGVAFLLKYAVDRRLLVFPIELRLVLVAAAAIALLVVGWRLRDRNRIYALSLQGGGIGILYLTIFTSLRLYELVSPGFAFSLLFVLAVASGALAILQNARGLATLGAAGGFLAPILVSTGTGSHVALFSYYLLLNLMIVGVAWFKPWRELNLLGFVFTFVIGGWWGYNNYVPEMLGTTEPFVILYFLFYQLTAVLFALRQPPNLLGLVDGTLVFGTPVLAFAMQALLLADTEYGLAFSALGAALFYVLVAAFLQRRQPQLLRLMIESLVALAVAFGTLAIPLALDARWTAAAWALEGAALVWVGCRQERLLARAVGVALVIGAGISFLSFGWHGHLGPPILNGNLLGGWLIALAGGFAAWQLGRVTSRHASIEHLVGIGLLVYGACWWLGSGLAEIYDRLPYRFLPAASVLFLALTTLGVSAIAERLKWFAARVAALAALPVVALAAVVAAIFSDHPGGHLGWLAWPVAIGSLAWVLRRHEQVLRILLSGAHFLLAVLVVGLLMWELDWQADVAGLGYAWRGGLTSLVPGLALLAVLAFAQRPGWPVGMHARLYRAHVGAMLLVLQGLVILWLNLGTDGAADPLPYVPLINPVDLASLFALLVAARWVLTLARETGAVDTKGRHVGLSAIGAAAFVVSTVALLRALHHLGGVPWDTASLGQSVLVQAALSVYWGLLAFVGMVSGAKLARRWLWLAGAALMAAVVIKLFLVDLGNTGTVARIVSFIGTGALLLVVGYLAPVPPRHKEAGHD
jgi:uncharacterized membrane protein